MDHKTILHSESGGMATLTLNRPEKRNAISYELIDDLTAALKQAAEFCSASGDPDGRWETFSLRHGPGEPEGADRPHAGAEPPGFGDHGVLFRSLYDSKPTIAAVNGPAIAGGTGLATLCDFTLAVPEAKFGYTEVRIGFVPAIVLSHLMANIGEKPARDLLLARTHFWR